MELTQPDHREATESTAVWRGEKCHVVSCQRIRSRMKLEEIRSQQGTYEGILESKHRERTCVVCEWGGGRKVDPSPASLYPTPKQ